MPEKLSLLLPVWAGDRPDYLAAAFTSSVQEQTRRPTRSSSCVTVRSPPRSPRRSTSWRRRARFRSRSSRSTRNIGLGPALDAGLAACTHDVVARMDADDLSLPHRFAVQMPIIEAGARPRRRGAGRVRRARRGRRRHAAPRPPTRDDIAARARFADPFNHPTVVYRREVVRAVGGYTDFALMEDYLLWAKMLVAGARVANVAEPLVRYRVGAGAYARRGGLAQLRAELGCSGGSARLGFTTWAQFLRNVAVRGGYRLVPERVRRALYRKVIATYGGGDRAPRRTVGTRYPRAQVHLKSGDGPRTGLHDGHLPGRWSRRP